MGRSLDEEELRALITFTKHRGNRCSGPLGIGLDNPGWIHSQVCLYFGERRTSRVLCSRGGRLGHQSTVKTRQLR